MEEEHGRSSISPKKRNPSGKFVGSSQKTMIINLYKHLMNENPGMKYRPMVKELSTQTGIGKTTIENTISEYKRTGNVTSPNRKKPRVKLFNKLTEDKLLCIRKKVYDFWLRREIPNLQKMLDAVNNDPDLPSFSRSSLYRALKQLNFTYMVRKRNSALIEKDYIIGWRQEYIENIRQYRFEGRPIYFLGETCVNVGDCKRKLSVDTTVTSPKNAAQSRLSTSIPEPSGKDKRLIILHIGSSDGFLPGGLLYFQSKKDSVDYHKEMNEHTFFTWFKKILPMLKEKSIIVMDNACYHSMKIKKYPNLSWKRQDIITWLTDRGEKVKPHYLKELLLTLVEKYKRPDGNNYAIDEYARQFGHVVLHLPPYHFELNVIGMAWAQIRSYIREGNTTCKLSDVQNLVQEAVENVTAETWKNWINHTIEVENKFNQLDTILDEILDEGDSWMLDDSDDYVETDSENE